jgi:hypothetical protein
MTPGSDHTRRNAAQRARASEAGTATTLTLMLCLAALVAAALILGMFATGLAHHGGGSSPTWSGAQGPPGAVGLASDHGVLHQSSAAAQTR